MTGADIFAHAIVASARSYGDDPLMAAVVVTGKSRRAMLPAAVGISIATGMSLERVGKILGIQTKNLSRAANDGGEGFSRAVALASTAARMALNAMGLNSFGVPSLAGRNMNNLRVAAGVPVVVAPRVVKPANLGTPNPRTLTGKILLHLREQHASASALATILGAKELQVSQALQQLETEGKVTPGTSANGTRHRNWFVTADGAA